MISSTSMVVRGVLPLVMCAGIEAQAWIYDSQYFLKDVVPGVPGEYVFLDNDRDGLLDIMCGWGSGYVWFRGFAHGGFGPANFVTVPNLPCYAGPLVVGDMSNDGVDDLVLSGIRNPSSTSNSTTALLVGNGQGGFSLDTQGRLPPSPSGYSFLAVLDCDKDGRKDLLLGVAFSQVRLLVNHGSTMVDETALRLPGFSGVITGMVTRDFNEDGYPDILITVGLIGAASGVNQLWLNDGTGRFTPSSALGNIAGYTNTPGVGDINGDGHLDILLTHLVGPPNLYEGDGLGGFQDVTYRLPASALKTWYGGGIGDVTGDGLGDIIFIPNPVQSLGVFVASGSGAFVDYSIPTIPGVYGSAIVLRDFDGDGDVDILASFYKDYPPGTASGAVILRHALRQLLVTQEPTVGGSLGMTLFAWRGNYVVPYLGGSKLPVSVPPYGTWHLDPLTSVGLPAVYMTSHVQTWSLPVPALQSLRGKPLYVQAIDFNPTAPYSSHGMNLLELIVR